MLVLLIAFSLFHLCAGAASLGLAVRLLTREERANWRSKPARLIAEAMCWTYPILAAICAFIAWSAFNADNHAAVPLILAPLAWLLVMGAALAIVDYAEDGVLGNARTPGADR